MGNSITSLCTHNASLLSHPLLDNGTGQRERPSAPDGLRTVEALLYGKCCVGCCSAPLPQFDSVDDALQQARRHANRLGGTDGREDYSLALHAYSKSIQMLKETDGDPLQLGAAYFELGKVILEHQVCPPGVSMSAGNPESLALPFFMEATRLNPEDHASWFYAGLAMQQQKRLREAVSCFQKSQAAGNGDLQCIFQIGVLSSQLGDVVAAKKHLREVLSADPHHTGALTILADLLEENGDLHDALKHYVELAEIEPEDRGLRHKIRQLQLQLGVTPLIPLLPPPAEDSVPKNIFGPSVSSLVETVH